MAIISVMYPSKAGSRFDMDYYLNTHMTMVAETWGPVGLRGYTVLQGLASSDGSPPPFQAVVNLDFESPEAFHAAVDASGAKVMGDVPNFTDLQPSLQISNVAGTYTGGG